MQTWGICKGSQETMLVKTKRTVPTKLEREQEVWLHAPSNKAKNYKHIFPIKHMGSLQSTQSGNPRCIEEDWYTTVNIQMVFTLGWMQRPHLHTKTWQTNTSVHHHWNHHWWCFKVEKTKTGLKASSGDRYPCATAIVTSISRQAITKANGNGCNIQWSDAYKTKSKIWKHKKTNKRKPHKKESITDNQDEQKQ